MAAIFAQYVGAKKFSFVSWLCLASYLSLRQMRQRNIKIIAVAHTDAHIIQHPNWYIEFKHHYIILQKHSDSLLNKGVQCMM